MMLVKIKGVAVAHLGRAVSSALVAISAHFSGSQRQATKDVGTMPGLNVLCITNEPAAAVLVYDLNKIAGGERSALIFDLGTGTFNAFTLGMEDAMFGAKSTAGDFYSRTVEHFVPKFKQKRKKDVTSNMRALRHLRSACENAKRTMSLSAQANLEVCSFYEEMDLYTSVTRVQFEELNADLFLRALDPAEKALRDSKFDENRVHKKAFMDGSTRIPEVRKLLLDFYDVRGLNKPTSLAEAIAYGAAVQAAISSVGY